MIFFLFALFLQVKHCLFFRQCLSYFFNEFQFNFKMGWKYCLFSFCHISRSTCQPTSFLTSRQTCLRRWNTFISRVTASPVFPRQHLKALRTSRASSFGNRKMTKQSWQSNQQKIESIMSRCFLARIKIWLCLLVSGLTSWLWAPQMRKPSHICPVYKSWTSVQETLIWPSTGTR